MTNNFRLTLSSYEKTLELAQLPPPGCEGIELIDDACLIAPMGVSERRF